MILLSARVGLAAALLMVPTWAFGQALGTVAGTVRDATGAVLPGVSVEASSPALIEKVRIAQTDGEGQFRIIELRSGTYTITFTLDGFSAVRREGIELTTGFTATVNADLRVGNIAETIVVTGQSPVVDLQNTRQQVVLTREVIDSVPTGRSFQNLGILVPGMLGSQVVGSTISQDVGGQSGQNFMTLAIHGGRGQDQRIELDGMSMSAWTRPDSSALHFSDGNFQEYNIDYASKSADSETGGVRINMIPREGGNTFRSSFFANASLMSLQGANVTPALKQQGLADPNKLKSLWSVNPTLGGPIAPDKMWFFGTFSYQVADQYVANSYLNTDPTAWDYAPDRTQQAVDDQYSRDVSGRLTWQVTARNKVTAYTSVNFSCHCHFLIGGATRSDASLLLHIPNYLYQMTWTLPLTNRFLIDVGGSYILQDQQFMPRPESVLPQISDTGKNVTYRASTTIMGAYTPVYASRGSASYVTGTHSMKVGYNLTMGFYRNSQSRVGNMSFGALNGEPTRVTYFGTPSVATNRVWPNLGIYAQDQWTLRRLTANAGLRFDYFRSDYPDQYTAPSQFVLTARSFPAKEAVRWTDLNPRLGLSYDLFGNGKTAVKTSLSRYIQGEGVGRASAINPILNNNSVSRQWTDRNGDRIVQGDPFNPAINGELGVSGNLNFGKPVITTVYNPEWSHGYAKRPYNWEFSAGVQQEIVPRMSANVMFFRRSYGNFTITQNRAVTPANYDHYCVTAPVDPRLPDGGGQQICGLYDLNPTKVGQTDNLVIFSKTVGDQYERWNGVDLTVNARLPRLLLQGGMSTGKTVTDDCDVAPKIGSPQNRFCHTDTRYLTQVKVLASYSLPWDVQLAGTFQSIPGVSVTASATFTNPQIAPSLGRALSSGSTATVALIEPGTIYRDRLNQLDVRLARTFRLGQRRAQLQFDLYNTLNAGTITAQSNNYGATTGANAGAPWQIPQAIIPARVVKFGLQLNF
jgi:hypothetical protein